MKIAMLGTRGIPASCSCSGFKVYIRRFAYYTLVYLIVKEED